MQRKLLPFVGVLVGLYLGLGLLLRTISAPHKHAPDPELLSDTLLKLYTPPLLNAVTQGDRHEATRLLQTGADPNGSDRVGRTPLLVAARSELPVGRPPGQIPAGLCSPRTPPRSPQRAVRQSPLSAHVNACFAARLSPSGRASWNGLEG